MVESTSVLLRWHPAHADSGPNWPSDRAQANVPAVNIPRSASGRTTRLKACRRLQPSVRNATCSPRLSIWSNVARIVRTANADATMNCAESRPAPRTPPPRTKTTGMY